ncbi:hypothetical protein J3E68DRAFT_96375 [Trichoderma sp. SZMC 28012]
MASTKKQLTSVLASRRKVISKEKGLPQKKKVSFSRRLASQGQRYMHLDDTTPAGSRIPMLPTPPFPPSLLVSIVAATFFLARVGFCLRLRNKRSPLEPFWRASEGTFSEQPRAVLMVGTDSGNRAPQLAFWGNTRASVTDHCVEMEPLAVRRSLRGCFGSTGASAMHADRCMGFRESLPGVGESEPWSSAVQWSEHAHVKLRII